MEGGRENVRMAGRKVQIPNSIPNACPQKEGSRVQLWGLGPLEILGPWGLETLGPAWVLASLSPPGALQLDPGSGPPGHTDHPDCPQL